MNKSYEYRQTPDDSSMFAGKALFSPEGVHDI